MTHPLRCQCGALKGFVENPRTANRAICYCRDCQAFAHWLGRQDAVLDARGGSDILQILPRNITLTEGTEALACIRLTPQGLLRWYAGCCNTPLGNTLATPKVSFIGLVHNCLDNPDRPLDEAFGPVRAWVHTQGARGEPKPRQAGLGTSAAWFITNTLKARFNGSYKITPFFRSDTGAPVASARVLSSDERAGVMSAVRAAAS